MHLSLSYLALLLLTVIITLSPLADSRIFDDALDANSLAQQDLEKVILQTPTNIHRTRPHRPHTHPHPHPPPHPHINKKTSEGDQETEENDVAEEETSPSEEGPSGAITYVIGMLDKAFHFLNLKKIVKNVQNHRSTPGACYACRAAMAMVKFLIEYGRGLSDVAYVTSYFCKSLDVQTPRVCEGYVNNFMEEFVVVMSKVDIDSHEICGTLLGDSCSQVTDPRHNWSLPLPPTVRRRKSLLQRPFSSLFWQQSSFNGGGGGNSNGGGAKRANAVSAVKPFKVLQISDIHLDPEYKEGSNAVCGEPLCCRPSSPGSNLAINADRKAGYWGDYRDCDIPLHTVEETFRYIRDNHPDIDYILWTGDIPPHDIWSQTRDSQLELINVVGSLLDQYFGHIPIYPVVGNHESLPMNSFPQPTAEIENKYTKSWLYDKLSESWLRWLPLETQATIEKGAFFAARPKSGLKIISLNTNFCNNQNWWILLNSTDPGDQLQWLIKQLTESEELGEMVQILGHVPPGSSDCIQMWSRNYNSIINRFAHIIKGQFFGHTHNDEFEIFYEDVTPRTDQTFFYDKTYKATNVAYIGPSITTFGNVNPGYRIYTVDPYSFDLLDHETFFLNLTAANGHRNSQQLQFEKSYSAKKAYGLKNLSAAEWHKLVMRMRTPRSSEDRVNGAVQTAERLFQQFYRYFYNRSDNVGDNRCDDESCKYEILCRLVTALSQDTSICRHFLM